MERERKRREREERGGMWRRKKEIEGNYSR
jgi:hypothetical protein